MRITTKTEFIFGILSFIAVCVLLIFTIYRYERSQKQLRVQSEPLSQSSKDILTLDLLSTHSQSNDCWLLISEKIYDATDYLSRHPGGEDEIIPYCGKDATQPFLTLGGRGTHSSEAFQQLGMLYVGDLNGETQSQPNTDEIRSLPLKNEDDD